MSIVGRADERALIEDFSGPGLRSIVAIDAVTDIPGWPGVGSGILIGPRSVLTAGHVVFDIFEGVSRNGGRITIGSEVANLPSRPNTDITSADLNFSVSGVYYPDDYHELGRVGNSVEAFGRDIAVVNTSVDVGQSADLIGLMGFVSPDAAKGYEITTGGFPARIEEGSKSINIGTVVRTDSDGSKITEALIGYTASGTVFKGYSDGRFSFSQTIDAEKGQSGSGIWSTIDDGYGNQVVVALGVHTYSPPSGFELVSSNGGHLITLNEYYDIHDALRATGLTPDANVQPINVLVGTKEGILARLSAPFVSSSSGDDYISGSWTRERIIGESGDDRLRGYGADDVIDGGDGIDQALFRDPFAEYDITIVDAVRPIVQVSHRLFSIEGTDTLRDVEFAVFEFNDDDPYGDPGHSIDDDGELFFVPLQVDPNDPTKLRDGPLVNHSVEVSDATGNRFGDLSVEIPAFMFDGDVDYSLSLGIEDRALYNFAYIVDSSGSMSGFELDQTKAAYQSLTEALIDQGVADNSQFAVIDFDTDAVLYSGLDAAGAIATVNSLTADGSTNFGAALTQAETWFEGLSNVGVASNIAFFLSDGAGSGASEELQLVNEGLTNEASVDVRAFGIGSGADLEGLNTIDSNSAVILDSAAGLIDAFNVSGVAKDLIERIDVKVNGSVVDSITPDELADGVLGLSYEGSIDGLTVTRTAENLVEFDLVFNNGDPTATLLAKITTGQDEVRQQTSDGTQTVVNFSVNQFEYVAAGPNEEINGNDLANNFTTSGGRNEIIGNGGDDRFSLSADAINIVDGGESTDTAVFDRTRAEVGEIRQSGAVTFVGDNHTLTNVEFIEFTDGRIDTSTLGVVPVARIAEPVVTISEDPLAGGIAQFAVDLSTPAPQDIEVVFATRDSSAVANQDYIPISQSVIIPAGGTQALFAATILADDIVEGEEEFFVDVTLNGAATLENGLTAATAGVQILDDDTAIGLLISGDGATFTEGGPAGVGRAGVTLERIGDLSGVDDILYAVGPFGGTPADATDFEAGFPIGTVRFEPGEQVKSIEFPIAMDRIFEPNETFALSLTSVAGDVAVPTQPSVFTIDDDDLISVALFDIAQQQEFAPIVDGSLFDAAALAGLELGLSVNLGDGSPLEAQAAQVLLDLDGPIDVSNTESVEPYSLFGSPELGDFTTGREFVPGDYSLKIEPFTIDGTSLGTTEIDFSVEHDFVIII